MKLTSSWRLKSSKKDLFGPKEVVVVVVVVSCITDKGKRRGNKGEGKRRGGKKGEKVTDQASKKTSCWC